MKLNLTEKYMKAFSDKDLNEISNLLHEQVVLEDPQVIRLEGKVAVIKNIDAIFKSAENISFVARNIYQDKTTTIIEFIININETRLTGVDVIEWKENKIISLRAYLNLP